MKEGMVRLIEAVLLVFWKVFVEWPIIALVGIWMTILLCISDWRFAVVGVLGVLANLIVVSYDSSLVPLVWVLDVLIFMMVGGFAFSMTSEVQEMP